MTYASLNVSVLLSVNIDDLVSVQKSVSSGKVFSFLLKEVWCRGQVVPFFGIGVWVPWGSRSCLRARACLIMSRLVF